MKKINTIAKIQITIEFPAACAWGENTSVGQVYAQAKESALTRLSSILQNTGCTIIGEPRVLSVSSEEER